MIDVYALTCRQIMEHLSKLDEQTLDSVPMFIDFPTEENPETLVDVVNDERVRSYHFPTFMVNNNITFFKDDFSLKNTPLVALMYDSCCDAQIMEEKEN